MGWSDTPMTHNRIVFFRTEADSRIGLGHLQRCLSLAVALRRYRMESVFLINPDPVAHEWVAREGFRIEAIHRVSLGGERDVQAALAAAAVKAPSLMVLDSYRLGDGYRLQLKNAGLSLVAVTDGNRQPRFCRLVVNASPHGDAALVARHINGTQVLTGFAYAVLRPEFSVIPTRTIRREVREILITVGGTDLRGLIPRLLAMLDSLAGNFCIRVAVGPFVKDPKRVRECAAVCRRKVEFLFGLPCLRDAMLQADLAISGGGQTLYELANTGTPTVAIQVAENQTPTLRAFAAEGAIEMVGKAEERSTIHRVKALVERLLANETDRQRLSRNGRRLVDGRGAERVARKIASLA